MTDWILAALIALVPPVLHEKSTYASARESEAAARQRYAEVARDIAEAAEGDRFGAALLVVYAVREGGMARDVDIGPCDPERVKKGGCDGARAKGLWQVHGLEGWPERREMARIALRRLRGSMNVCRELPEAERLVAYGTGGCLSERGRAESRRRWEAARSLVR